MSIAGQCLCGTVRWELAAPPVMMLHCHCSMCRKTHGSAFVTYAVAPLASFRHAAGTEGIVQYRSSSQALRPFCRRCGSATPWLDERSCFAICPAGNLDGELGLKPQLHMFVGSKAPWHTITDELPQFPEYPPGFGLASVPCAAVAPKPGVTQGSCLCGRVAYEFNGAPQRMYNCHCQRCRRGRGAAHATNLFVKLEQFHWVRGQDDVADFALPGARFFGTAFCRHCGSRLPRIYRDRGAAAVPCGSLDDDPLMRPQVHLYVGSKAPWFDITDALPQFAEGAT